ncbi:MAG: polysaccharide biosynthesis protein [Erysipelotrichaceae bacterium]|nr:polysaccharide biosynthesis protein [Erysipelotrichaceae bacterium]
MKKVMFISSGGGHLEELLQLESLFSRCEYSLITEKTATTLYLKEKYPNTSYLVYGTKDHLLPYLFIFPFNILKSFFLFLKYRPDAVVTTGTHTAVPMCYIAHLFHKKVVFIETMANAHKPTKAGKMVYKIADKFIVQWESMKEVYPDSEYWGSVYS